MSRSRLALTILGSFAFAPLVRAQAPADSLTLPEVTVVATRLPVGPEELTRAVTVRDGAALVATPGAVSLEDALDRLPGVHLTNRGGFGVQSDLSLRGATFGQQLLVLNGQRLSDPQTGHFLLDLPLVPADLQRVEILHGPAATLYGPDAFGGVVHVVTAPVATGVRVEQSVGEKGLRTGSARLGFANPLGGLRLNGSWRRTDGHRPNTDFDGWSAGGRLDAHLPMGTLQIEGGFLHKVFGAADFYASPGDRLARERTETALLTAALPMLVGRTRVTPRLLLRRAFDHYVFSSARPTLYVADHRKETGGGEIELNRRILRADLTTVSEVSTERIVSDKLGNHSLTRFGQGVLVHGRTAPVPGWGTGLVDLGVRVDHHQDFGWQTNPSVGLGLLTESGFKLRGAVSRSFRAPSFTERYNPGGGNLGRADLRPETGWSYELGADSRPSNGFNASLTGFIRTSRDVIDFVRRPAPSTIYDATNIAEVMFKGVEVTVDARPTLAAAGFRVLDVGLGYTYLDGQVELPTGTISKYAVSHPRHQGTVTLGLGGPLGSALTVTGVVKQPASPLLKGYGRWDARLSLTRWGITPFAEGLNLFDQPFAEFPGITAPGRWLRAGLIAAW